VRRLAAVALALAGGAAAAQDDLDKVAAWINSLEYSAGGVQWLLVDAGDGAMAYLTPQMATRNRDIRKVWIRLEYGPEATNVPHRSSRILLEADCVQARTRWLSTTDFPMTNLRGEMVGSWTAPVPSAVLWSPVPPGTLQEDLWRKACTITLPDSAG
jgi:hypothetical protein